MDTISKRFKNNYEMRSRSYLYKKIPAIVRVDGKSFHTFCRRFEKPYSQDLNDALNSVMFFLCKEIQGAKFAQRYSDEISILMTDYDTNQTDSFFGYEIQKIDSVVASWASTELCKILLQTNCIRSDERWPVFDCRCFNIPHFEITSYFWMRMLDAKRNSIQGLSQSKFSDKQLHGKNTDDMQEMLFLNYGINWNNIPQEQKTGNICLKEKVEKISPKGEPFTRAYWQVKASPRSVEKLFSIIKAIEYI